MLRPSQKNQLKVSTKNNDRGKIYDFVHTPQYSIDVESQNIKEHKVNNYHEIRPLKFIHTTFSLSKKMLRPSKKQSKVFTNNNDHVEIYNFAQNQQVCIDAESQSIKEDEVKNHYESSVPRTAAGIFRSSYFYEMLRPSKNQLEHSKNNKYPVKIANARVEVYVKYPVKFANARVEVDVDKSNRLSFIGFIDSIDRKKLLKVIIAILILILCCELCVPLFIDTWYAKKSDEYYTDRRLRRNVYFRH